MYILKKHVVYTQAAANSTSQEWSRDFEWSSRVKSLLVDKFKLATFRPLQVRKNVCVYVCVCG
jgi:hypothetical protein